jgi:hypothetical protein
MTTTADRFYTYAVEQRLRFIDFLLAQYGTVNRSALVDYFGISEPCATRDLREYQRLAPNNARYSLSSRTYERLATFQRLWP